MTDVHQCLQKFSQDLSPLIPIPPNTTTATSAEDDSHMFFSSDASKATLDRVLAMHFVRSGREDVEKVFLKVSWWRNTHGSPDVH